MKAKFKINKEDDSVSWDDLTCGLWVPTDVYNCLILVTDNGYKLYIDQLTIEEADGWEDERFVKFDGVLTLQN